MSCCFVNRCGRVRGYIYSENGLNLYRIVILFVFKLLLKFIQNIQLFWRLILTQFINIVQKGLVFVLLSIYRIFIFRIPSTHIMFMQLLRHANNWNIVTCMSDMNYNIILCPIRQHYSHTHLLGNRSNPYMVHVMHNQDIVSRLFIILTKWWFNDRLHQCANVNGELLYSPCTVIVFRLFIILKTWWFKGAEVNDGIILFKYAYSTFQ